MSECLERHSHRPWARGPPSAAKHGPLYAFRTLTTNVIPTQ